MSLRIFHIVFIIASVALCGFVAVWGLQQYNETRNATGLTTGVLFLVGGVALILYLFRAFQKLRQIP